KENGIGGFIALGVGTSMLQVANIIRNPFIIIPPTIAGAIIGPIGITMFEMTNNTAGAGMGTSGFVGQIMMLETMGFTINTFILCRTNIINKKLFNINNKNVFCSTIFIYFINYFIIIKKTVYKIKK